ncbi:MAG: polymerase, bacteriophage type [Actinomycetia bacterium]|nr:polymerase, bacteriophage type [Actinomycetes bacterium]
MVTSQSIRAKEMSLLYAEYAAQLVLQPVADGKRLVPGTGPVDSPLVVVGEAPGAEEEKQGEPFCLIPDHLVLMADLTWKPLGDIRTGDQILAPDEHGAPQERSASGAAMRRWRIAEVTNVTWSQRPVQHVVTDTGDLWGTPDHRVLTAYQGKSAHLKRWLPIGALMQGSPGPHNSGSRSSAITWVGSPWKPQSSWEAGWVSGFFDGEGHVANQSKIRVGYAQNLGPTQEKAERMIAKVGFRTVSHGEQRVGDSICSKSYIAGGYWEVLRFLGEIRPERLLANARRTIASTPPSIRGAGASRVMVRESIRGERDVVDITTTTGTFIADGFVVHNCGPSGQLLQELFGEAGLPWELCYRTNVLPWRPPGNRTPHNFEVVASYRRLEREIDLVSPARVIAAGAVAWQGVSQGDFGSFAASRGQWVQAPWKDWIVMPVFHPAAILRASERREQQQMRADTIAALRSSLAPS